MLKLSFIWMLTSLQASNTCNCAFLREAFPRNVNTYQLPAGDLAKKKIYPALFALYYENMLPENFSVFGYARSKMGDEEFREYIGNNLTCRLDDKEKCGDRTQVRLSKIYWLCWHYSHPKVDNSVEYLLYETVHGHGNVLDSNDCI